MACGVVAALVLHLVFTQAAIGASADRPNIVFILADDLGWSDTTLFGTTTFYETPNMERLAKRGMVFSRAYSASPLCSPTRASILTGLSPARHGITSPSCHLPAVVLKATPGERAPASRKAIPVNSVTRLDTKYQTLAETLKDAGYATGHFGKWHLGHEPYSPLEHGFDVDVPHWAGPGPAGSYVAPWRFPDFDPDTPDEHIEDRMAREAIAFMEEHRDEPFFLNYWMFSVHAPFDAKKQLIDKYRKRVQSENPQRCPTYAAMIESMDDAVGTLLETIDRLGVARRTIVVFASDNGGNMYNVVEGERPTSNAPLRGGKATMFEGGVRGPCVVVWPDVVASGSRSSEIVQSCDFYPTLLEILEIKPKPTQQFDGVSLVPALKGGKLERRRIFTYFPHNPRVPDWLPPSVSVHEDHWKLIRIFYGGENGAHRWKLFNLKNDVGERRNLADAQPDLVKRLDARIEAFLDSTNAVRPTRNPAFDPAQYRPDQEGKQIPKGPARKRAVRVAGWTASKDCRLAVRNQSLVFTNTGRDPFASFQLPKPIEAGELVLHLTLSSNTRGRGQWFWRDGNARPAFHRDRSVVFDLEHDGKAKEYQIPFAAKSPIIGVRLDPGQGAGEVRITALKITDRQGRLKHSWSFSPPKKKAAGKAKP